MREDYKVSPVDSKLWAEKLPHTQSQLSTHYLTYRVSWGTHYLTESAEYPLPHIQSQLSTHYLTESAEYPLPHRVS